MGRHPTGAVALAQARLDLATAKTVDQLRAAQAVVMPLDLGLSLRETAQVIGKTPGWVARARMRYINGSSQSRATVKRGGRRNNLLSLDEERRFVDIAKSHQYPCRPAASELKKALDHRLGRLVALSTAYKMLRRVAQAGRAAEE